MTLKCDLQYGKGDAEYKLTRVGVKGVRKPILVQREGINGTLNHILNCSIDIYVDLPGDQKGSHMSRNVEVLNEIVEESVKKPITAIEDVAADICRKLMVHHEYAKEGEVHIEAEYFRASKTPLGKDTFESYTLLSGGHIERDGEITKMVGVEVIGMTACPCGQQTVTEMLEIQSEHPVMTHNQRNVVTLMVYLPEDRSVEANDLIDLVEASFSSPTYELLKRPDEGQVIINAHSNTKFVEDVVRAVLDNFVKKYPDLPDDVFVDVISDSEESIHKHDAFAEREATLGELRQENQ
ncbi:MAG: GTP cyclohydrolase I FolE2 [Thermoplasmata archaeon]|jgi:GTP cyclohydrolase-4|nr:GTP cyclohydrolase I FolE2 [Thermoplasmata archaeon]MBR4244359.1 GTP cyclohydrolase I FolE2 [Candidatus Methanomethylophilaceae archaeon]MBR6213161.1 GTP cyclohydrolase I FolE2 [Candidatus Methanomethylophilaceae archaeon]